jgi:putative Mg2+ transporter-C (MgtC) family protein
MFDPSTTEVTMRVIAALLCGGAIGFDRELRSHSAGMRTHALAAEGAALFTIAGILIASEAHKSGYPAADPGRVASTVAQGIGFLAAGVIFGSAAHVRGLTTAAGLWTTAAVGMLCGGGFYEIAAISTVATLVVLSIFKVVEVKIDSIPKRIESSSSNEHGSS